MLSIILKNFFVMKKMLLLYVLAAIFAIMGNGSMLYFVIGYSALSLYMTQAYDERSGWLKFESSLPLSKTQQVLARFLFVYINMVFAIIFSMIFDVVNRMLFHRVLESEPKMTLLIIGVNLIAFALTTPVLLKIGVEKSRLIMIVFFVAIFTAIPLTTLTTGLTAGLMTHLDITVLIVMISAVIINIGSFVICSKISWYVKG